jgi:hypothetical protein
MCPHNEITFNGLVLQDFVKEVKRFNFCPSQKIYLTLEKVPICLQLFFLFMHDIQHCVICHPSDSIVSEDAGTESRTVATTALAVRRSIHSARSHPHSARCHPHSARSHPHTARSHRLAILSWEILRNLVNFLRVVRRGITPIKSIKRKWDSNQKKELF